MKRLALPLVLLVVLALLAAACGGGDTATGANVSKLEKVTVVLDWTPNTNHSGLYLAKEKGWYREAGIDLRILEPGAAGAVQLLASGKADVAVSAQEELIPARAQGIPVVAIAAIVQHNTSSLLSLTRSGIEGPSDLPGHTFGGFGGPLEKALVRKLISCAGGDPSKVRFAEVGDVDYRVGLEKGQFDFVWVFDGWDKVRLAQIDHLAVNSIPFIDHTDCIPDWYTPMLATTAKTIARRAASLHRFMDVTRRGYQAAMADPAAAAAALTAAVPELDPNLIRRSANYLATRFADDPKQWGHQDAAVWKRFVAFLTDSGLIDKPIDVKSAFTNRFLDGS